jgi:hypothetical protein
VGILTSQNPETPEGLKSQLSVEIHRILAELPHFNRASVLELLR